MTKHLCDCCGGELKITKTSEFDIIYRSYDWYEFKRLSFFSFNFWPSFSKEKMEICSKCMDDFREFVHRKGLCKSI